MGGGGLGRGDKERFKSEWMEIEVSKWNFGKGGKEGIGRNRRRGPATPRVCPMPASPETASFAPMASDSIRDDRDLQE